ncbi:MAG: hypothetical protein H8D56_12760 [Planctomycetes bacterium]|nr:hypothetical protein [Planctomycetota bacterium]MBL7143858.1 hypothetical protein [Phycisphaerae bacterium]
MNDKRRAQVNSLKTREQRFRAMKWDRMFVSRSVITSKAFLALRTAAACQVFSVSADGRNCKRK